MGARYIFGNKNFGNVSHMLSNITSEIISNPYKLENILGMVRTFAPLASVQTVGKINTFLPTVERISSILGMYSFLNKAQNYAPIQSLADKPTMEKVTSLISNGNIPISKILAQPIIAKNMEKVIGAVASNFINNSIKNGNLDQMISGLMSQMNNNSNNNNNINNQQTNTNNTTENNKNIDLNSILQMLGPILNNINTNNNDKQ